LDKENKVSNEETDRPMDKETTFLEGKLREFCEMFTPAHTPTNQVN
jgi:hypothetical protein